MFFSSRQKLHVKCWAPVGAQETLAPAPATNAVVTPSHRCLGSPTPQSSTCGHSLPPSWRLSLESTQRAPPRTLPVSMGPRGNLGEAPHIPGPHASSQHKSKVSSLGEKTKPGGYCPQTVSNRTSAVNPGPAPLCQSSGCVTLGRGRRREETAEVGARVWMPGEHRNLHLDPGGWAWPVPGPRLLPSADPAQRFPFLSGFPPVRGKDAP